MSNKNLLNEATVRRFMKLANMEPLTSPFVDRLEEMHCPSGDRDDDEVPMEEAEATEAMEETYDAPADRDDDMAIDDVADEPPDLDLDAEAGDDDAGALEPAVRDRVEAALADALEALADELGDQLGLDIGVEEDADEVELEVPDAPEPPAVDLPDADDDDDLMAEDEEVVAEDDELALESVEVVDDNDLINEVAKRVTARLVKAMAKK